MYKNSMEKAKFSAGNTAIGLIKLLEKTSKMIFLTIIMIGVRKSGIVFFGRGVLVFF